MKNNIEHLAHQSIQSTIATIVQHTTGYQVGKESGPPYGAEQQGKPPGPLIEAHIAGHAALRAVFRTKGKSVIQLAVVDFDSPWSWHIVYSHVCTLPTPLVRTFESSS